MMPACLIKYRKCLFIRIFNMLVSITLLCFFSAVTGYSQCDMGNAYSYTDMWVVGGEDADPDGNGIVEIDDSNPLPPAYVVGQGIVENSYNSCGHEYYTNVTVTGPDGNEAYGQGSATLEIFIDGDFFTESDLIYYCPFAGRDFEGGTSYNTLDATTNEIYYGYKGEQLVGGFKVCKYRACVETDTNPVNGCYFVEKEIHIRPPESRVCPPGTYSKFIKARLAPFFPWSPLVCKVFIHNELTFNPCPFGTL